LIDGDKWKEEIFQAIGGDITQITRGIGLQLGRIMKQVADDMAISARPELEAGFRSEMSDLLLLVDKHAAPHQN